MSNAKKQHYVPQSYLERFNNGITGKINVFDKRILETRKNQNIADVAENNKFYEIDDIDLEGELASIEGDFKDMIDIIINRVKSINWFSIANRIIFNDDLKMRFAKHLAIQHARTVSIRNTFQTMQELIAGVLIKRTGTEDTISIDKYKTKRMHLETINEENIITKAVFFVNTYNWFIDINKTDTPYWTSDNPVCIIGDARGKGYTMILFPLTPNYLLRLEGKTINVKTGFSTKDVYKSINEIDLINACNIKQVEMADRCIFSNKENFSVAEKYCELVPKVRTNDYMEINPLYKRKQENKVL